MATTSEGIRRSIAVLEGVGSCGGGYVGSTPVHIYLQHVHQNTSNYADIELQLVFVRVVMSILLNTRSEEGQPQRAPRDAQVEAVHRIVYNVGDTILLARTGYGKSIVFQAVSVILPDKVTIIIVPLSMLGEDQCRSIQRFPTTTPIFIDETVVKVCYHTPP